MSRIVVMSKPSCRNSSSAESRIRRPVSSALGVTFEDGIDLNVFKKSMAPVGAPVNHYFERVQNRPSPPPPRATLSLESPMNPHTLPRRGLLRQAVSGAALVSALHAQNQPASSTARICETFDFGWKFLKGDSPGAQQPEFPDSAWRTVDLPHDWSIEGPFSDQEKSQGSLPTGIGWYRKRFRLPESYKDRTVLIEFDGIYQNSEVWINGQYLGKRPYGYVAFSYDLTPHLIAGRDNVIAVKVDT